MTPGGTPMDENDIGSHADRAVCGKRGLFKPTKNPRLAKCAHRGYPNGIFRTESPKTLMRITKL